MSAAAGRMASKVGSAASKVAGKAAESGEQKTGVLQKGAKKDPELYVCSCVIKPDYIACTSETPLTVPQILLAIMSGAFGLAGWHFGTPSLIVPVPALSAQS